MRLETPVVYFHPPPGAELPITVNLEVAFRGGWLSEYYPNAKVEAPGVKGEMSFGPISNSTIGRLQWDDLQIGTSGAGPKTDSHVWLAPRAVEAANVTALSGESERYVFYRGVGKLDSPLRVARKEAGMSLSVTAQFPRFDQTNLTTLRVPSLWLVNIRADKSCAFREVTGFAVPNDGHQHQVATTRATFDEDDYAANSLTRLAASLRNALIDDGLFVDEADALINTWKAAYFESPGLRLFYILPREWTDHVLPMNISIDAELVRTMVGRIELVTPKQRELLKRIAAGPASDARWIRVNLQAANAELQPEPADYQAYRDLCRFRNSLLLDELNRRPTPALQSFIDGYGLHGYVVDR
jgi:hypothetical protein